MQNIKKFLISVTMLMLLCTFFVSTVRAADEVPFTTAPDNPLVTDEPNLISTADNSTSDNPSLIAPRENATATDTSVTGGDPDDNSLLSGKTSPDYTGYFVAAVALLAVIAVGLGVVVLRKRKA